uniref:Uncharacterized protein n=1 Tax=Lepeophtheirus salmonis TaxID=72036 RepID=A0A0K2URR2_LEPSM
MIIRESILIHKVIEQIDCQQRYHWEYLESCREIEEKKFNELDTGINLSQSERR